MERVYECGGASGAINTPIQWLREEGGDSAHGRQLNVLAWPAMALIQKHRPPNYRGAGLYID
jgi:hypothetical protein